MATPKFAMVGTLDFLPKVTIPGIVAALSGIPTYLWWYNYLIKAPTWLKENDVPTPPDGFVVIDNVNDEWFLIRALKTPTQYLPIHDGPVPAIDSEAERTPRGGNHLSGYLHIVDGNHRHVVVEQLKEVRAKFQATEVYLAITLTPDLLVAGAAYRE